MKGYIPLLLVLSVLVSHVFGYQNPLISYKLGKRTSFSAYRACKHDFIPKNAIGTIVNHRMKHYQNIANLLSSGMEDRCLFAHAVTFFLSFFLHSLLIVIGKIYKYTKNKVKNSIIYLGLFVLSVSRIVSPSGTHSVTCSLALYSFTHCSLIHLFIYSHTYLFTQ